MYTALLTPVMVGFYWNLPPCWRSPTLEFDVFLDSFFIFEIIYNFFVGIQSKGVSLELSSCAVVSGIGVRDLMCFLSVSGVFVYL
jgi:hypothetical protein